MTACDSCQTNWSVSTAHSKSMGNVQKSIFSIYKMGTTLESLK
jgi:hypothetical protein